MRLLRLPVVLFCVPGAARSREEGAGLCAGRAAEQVFYLGKSFGDRKIETAVDLCQYLLDEALVSTVPGEAYNVPGKIRISYSNSMENLEKALDRVEKALEALH